MIVHDRRPDEPDPDVDRHIIPLAEPLSPSSPTDSHRVIGVDLSAVFGSMLEDPTTMLEDLPRPDLTKGTHKIIGVDLGPNSRGAIAAVDGNSGTELKSPSFTTLLMDHSGVSNLAGHRSRAARKAEQAYLYERVDSVLRLADLQSGQNVLSGSTVTIGVAYSGFSEDSDYEPDVLHFKLHELLLKRCDEIGAQVVDVDETFIDDICPDCSTHTKTVKRTPSVKRCHRCFKSWNRHPWPASMSLAASSPICSACRDRLSSRRRIWTTCCPLWASEDKCSDVLLRLSDLTHGQANVWQMKRMRLKENEFLGCRWNKTDVPTVFATTSHLSAGSSRRSVRRAVQTRE